MSIIAHEEIESRFYSTEEFESGPVTLEIQHDPCIPGEVSIGVCVEGQYMYVSRMYLSRDAALSAAFALRAAVMHIDHPDMFTDESLDNEEQWRDAHAKALKLVMESYGKERW